MNERAIATAIARQTLAKKCVVLVDRCNWTGHECDVLGITTNLRLIDIEIKISRSDLRADAKKGKWWHGGDWAMKNHQWVRSGHQLRQWPPRVWKHYYALPAEIWKPDLLDAIPSPASGVILLREQKYDGIVVASVERRATPNRDAYRLTPEQVMDVARLANIRMWQAYEQAAA